MSSGNQSRHIFGLKDIELAGNCTGESEAGPGQSLLSVSAPAKYHFKFARDPGDFDLGVRQLPANQAGPEALVELTGGIRFHQNRSV